MTFEFDDISMSYSSVYERVEGFSGVKQNVVDDARSNRKYSTFLDARFSYMDGALNVIWISLQYNTVCFSGTRIKSLCYYVAQFWTEKNLVLPIMSYISAKSEVIASVSYRSR